MSRTHTHNANMATRIIKVVEAEGTAVDTAATAAAAAASAVVEQYSDKEIKSEISDLTFLWIFHTHQNSNKCMQKLLN